jgi:hypothetical protein
MLFAKPVLLANGAGPNRAAVWLGGQLARSSVDLFTSHSGIWLQTKRRTVSLQVVEISCFSFIDLPCGKFSANSTKHFCTFLWDAVDYL